MSEVYLIDGIRTPIGRYGGALSSVRADDLGAVPIAALLARQSQLEPAAIDDVYLGCANQAGEDNRNVARMSLLLAGLPSSVPGSTLNRLCGSGLDAIGTVARGIRAGELDLAIAGGVESMSRAPWVMGKADSAFARTQQLEDTTMGWRFINPRLQAVYGTELMGKRRKTWRSGTPSRAKTRMRSHCAASNAWRRRRQPVSSMRKSPRWPWQRARAAMPPRSNTMKRRDPTPPPTCWPSSNRCSASPAP